VFGGTGCCMEDIDNILSGKKIKASLKIIVNMIDELMDLFA
jgi:hypothetical protein